VLATTTAGGKAGFKVPVVNLEIGGEASRQWQHTHTVTVVLGAPVDRTGVPVKVAQDSSSIKR